MAGAKYIIYKDQDDLGFSFTVYEYATRKCMGTFLDDDLDLAEYRKQGVEVDGLDNRY